MKTFLERFHAQTKPENDCLIWTGHIAKSNGYGRIRRAGKYELAHRAIWSELRGEIPPGLVIMHSCDNRACVNIDHLSLGTQKENIRDAIKKKRAPQLGPRVTVCPHCKCNIR